MFFDINKLIIPLPFHTSHLDATTMLYTSRYTKRNFGTGKQGLRYVDKDGRDKMWGW